MDKFHTRISKGNYSQIRDREMSPAELIEFLETGAVYRTFRDILVSVYQGEDLASRLAQGLADINGTEYENTMRKVRNWMKGSSVPQNREQLFQICFVLGLDEVSADRVIASASECGIHYRNPRELVYSYGLRLGMSYRDTVCLQEKMEPIYLPEMKKAKNISAQAWKKAKTFAGDVSGIIYTRQLKEEFGNVQTEEELESFLREHGKDMGEIHETAWLKFKELLDYLQNPQGGEETWSIKAISKEYLQMGVPNTKKTGGMTYLQKVVKKNWPTESEIEKMKNRSIDVSRKAMLLLFLVTEDFEYSAEYQKDYQELNRDIYYEDLIEEDSIERLEVRLCKINLFLDHYGMNLLDPGNPFDCLVLYALKMEYDGDYSVSENVRRALDVLFSEENDSPDDV